MGLHQSEARILSYEFHRISAIKNRDKMETRIEENEKGERKTEKATGKVGLIQK